MIPKDGQLELRSPNLILTIDPSILVNDPDIGQAISVAQIRNSLQTAAEFNIDEYAIVLSPPWLGKNLDNRQYQEKTPPVILEGLPRIDSPFVSFTGIYQRTNFNQIQGNNVGNGNLTYSSEFKVLGSVAGGSLFSGLRQYNNSTGSWQLNELQYYRPSAYTDYIVGTQSPFWTSINRNNQGEYFGFTIVQRLGYTPSDNTNFTYRGVNAQQRLNGNEVVRTVSGKTEPGTLVQLVTQNSNAIVAEQLVDGSGEYRFEKVVTATNTFAGVGKSINYKLLLYPKGNLSVPPEQIALNYLNLQGQINQGKSAIVVTAGANRTATSQNIFGNLDGFQLGAAGYVGVTDEITFGAGAVYNKSIQPYTELLYQPVNFPLTFRVGALIDKQTNFNADVRYTTDSLRLSFGGDQRSVNSNLYWALNPQLGVFSNFYSGGTYNRLESGFNLNLQPIFLSLSYDNSDTINGFFRANLNPVLIGVRKNRKQNLSELYYSFSGSRFFSSTGSGIRLGYESDDKNYLASANWVYRTSWLGRGDNNLLDFELGYGKNMQSTGVIASASANIFSGVGVRLVYSQVNLNNDNDSLTVNLFTSLLSQPSLNLSSNDTKIEKLRTQGGILLQPFLDKNSNGVRDDGEDFYTKDIEALFLINNQPLNQLGVSQAAVVGDGALFELPPNDYRLDTDPAGFPIGWKAVESAYAISVTPGGYTPVLIPLIPSYVVTGVVLDKEGKAAIGVSVQFISRSNPQQEIKSVTNSVGIYYLEDLKTDVYDLLINGQPVKPKILEINATTETFLELNLQL